jgi:hypothetical protein
MTFLNWTDDRSLVCHGIAWACGVFIHVVRFTKLDNFRYEYVGALRHFACWLPFSEPSAKTKTEISATKKPELSSRSILKPR